MALVPPIVENDWISVRTAIQKLASSKLGLDAHPTFRNVTLTDLTASRLVQTNASKGLASVSNLANWIAGTTNRITVSNDADGTITLTSPQDTHIGANPTFAGLTISDSEDNIVIFGDATIFYVVEPAAAPGVGNPIGLLLLFTYAS